MEPSILDTLFQLFRNLGVLVQQLAGLGYHWALWLFFIAVCLFAINWKRARHYLVEGGWAPLVLLVLLIALVWAMIERTPAYFLGFIWMPNFLWQLSTVTLMVLIAFFCGWLQSYFHWTPHDINLDPPAHGHGHGHDHGHSHGHH